MFLLRYDDQVYVVGHQTITVDDEAEPFRVRLQKAQICCAVVVDKEHILLVISALCYVVRYSDRHGSGNSRHVFTVGAATSERRTLRQRA